MRGNGNDEKLRHLKRSRMVQISASRHLPVRSYECAKIAMGKGRRRYKYKCV